eukprot:6193189-Pleurochrysis_carterae.AAC.4
MPLSQLGALRCPHLPLAARRLALSPSRSLAPCAVPLSHHGALRCPASCHPVPCAVSLLDTHRRRAPSLTAGAPCAFRL